MKKFEIDVSWLDVNTINSPHEDADCRRSREITVLARTSRENMERLENATEIIYPKFLKTIEAALMKLVEDHESQEKDDD